MRTFSALAAAAVLALAANGCEQLKTLAGREAEPAPDSVAAPAPNEPVAKTFRAPTKGEYYRLLREGYKPPRRAVRTGGPSYAGTASGERREISEKEGEGLKAKFGEGRKYAASGRGEEPKVPSYIDEEEDGTYPPREFQGHDQ
jgi:hypothetical protein